MRFPRNPFEKSKSKFQKSIPSNSFSQIKSKSISIRFIIFLSNPKVFLFLFFVWLTPFFGASADVTELIQKADTKHIQGFEKEMEENNQATGKLYHDAGLGYLTAAQEALTSEDNLLPGELFIKAGKEFKLAADQMRGAGQFEISEIYLSMRLDSYQRAADYFRPSHPEKSATIYEIIGENQKAVQSHLEAAEKFKQEVKQSSSSDNLLQTLKFHKLAAKHFQRTAGILEFIGENKNAAEKHRLSSLQFHQALVQLRNVNSEEFQQEREELKEQMEAQRYLRALNIKIGSQENINRSDIILAEFSEKGIDFKCREGFKINSDKNNNSLCVKNKIS